MHYSNACNLHMDQNGTKWHLECSIYFPGLKDLVMSISLTHFYRNNLFGDNVDVGHVMRFW